MDFLPSYRLIFVFNSFSVSVASQLQILVVAYDVLNIRFLSFCLINFLRVMNYHTILQPSIPVLLYAQFRLQKISGFKLSVYI